MNLANNLRKIRKENNLSQEQLAEKLGVSRQSVSKWESEQAYPEMEKMIQICEMFDITLDELLNQNVSVVNETKEESKNFAKHIDSFLNYINKTIDLISSMTHLQRFKCLVEQAIYVLVLTAVFGIVGAVCRNILDSIFNSWHILDVLENIYIAVCMLAGATLMFMIFKIRYLNYCEIAENPKSEKNEKLEIETKEEEPKTVGKKIFQREKIIIRDPNHSEYKFISGLVKILFVIFKIIVGMFGVGVCLCLVTEVVGIVLSFCISKSGFLFVGIIMALLGVVVATVIVLMCVYSILFNHKFRKSVLAIVFACSLALTGAGVGVGVIGTMGLQKVTPSTTQYVKTYTMKIDSAENFFPFATTDERYKYVVTDTDDITVVLSYPSYYDSISLENNDYGYGYKCLSKNYYDDVDTINTIKSVIDLINNHYAPTDFFEMNVYASQENINKMQSNTKAYFEKTKQ